MKLLMRGGDADAVNLIAQPVGITNHAAHGRRADVAGARRLVTVGVGVKTQEIVVAHHHVRVLIPGDVSVVDTHSSAVYLTTQLGLHEPPDELLVTRLAGSDTRVNPPGNTVTSPLPFWMANTRRSI